MSRAAELAQIVSNFGPVYAGRKHMAPGADDATPADCGRLNVMVVGPNNIPVDAIVTFESDSSSAIAITDENGWCKLLFRHVVNAYEEKPVTICVTVDGYISQIAVTTIPPPGTADKVFIKLVKDPSYVG